MRASQYLIATLKETPADAEIVSHQLMLRAGLIRKLASGMYTWLPMGVRVLQKVSQIVRDEMNRAGAMEVSMPVVQPADLWRESSRWDAMGPELLRFVDRHDREFCLGPTHEEVITDLIRNEYSSYKQLPANFYQIQTKFRDERRPRFGVMRAREFLMKDAYSFHIDEASLNATYQDMYQAYCNIFNRLGLDFRAVLADSGNIGGKLSHEFHVLADSGEDQIVFGSDSVYAANLELATGKLPDTGSPSELKDACVVDTGDAHSIDELTSSLDISASQVVKTLLVHGADKDEDGKIPLVALLLRGDQILNETKASKLPELASPIQFATDQEILDQLACKPGNIGPVNKDIFCIADHSVESMTNFVCGANQLNKHIVNSNWGERCHYDKVADLRTVQEGDISPDGKGTLQIKRGIEVGHIFQLGKKYSEAMNATVLDETGRSMPMIMGCYGIGVTRVVAACIEQNHDDKGIIWPNSITPFHLVIIPLDSHKSDSVVQVSESIWQAAQNLGLDVLLDDRDRKTSAGVKFADAELIGIPHRILVSPRTLAEGVVEYKARVDGDAQFINQNEVLDFLQKTILGK